MSSAPLSFLSDIRPREGVSLGDQLSDALTSSNAVNTLLDCLCATPSPAIHSSDPSRTPLDHAALRDFILKFSLPTDPSRPTLKQNDRVVLVLPPGPVNAVALLAVATYFTCAPLNATCTAAELKEDVQRLHASAIVTTRDVEERLDLVSLQKDLDCDVLYIQGRPYGPVGVFDFEHPHHYSLLSPRVSSAPHSLGDQSLILHTSGTSGKKKVVPYTLKSLLVGTWAVVHSWALKSDDVNLNMMPLFHVGGIVRNLLAPVLSGGCSVMCPGFDPSDFWTLAHEFQATWYYAAPTIHLAILNAQPDNMIPARDLRIRMICNAAGGLLPSLAVELKRRFNDAAILPSYGMTECMPIATPPTDYQLDRPGCSGIACGPYMSIRDPSNLERELACGRTGAISVRGLPTFEGYEVSPDPNVPLDTSSFTSEGWFDSGDLGYIDADGFLYVTGRSKEIINKGGEVISPFEIEEAITAVTKGLVQAALAFAIEHDILQETIGVVLVPTRGVPRLGLSQLHDLVKNNLHPSKWPFAIVYMDDVPKNSAGKPLRIQLGTRLGLGCMTDKVPMIKRHFEAKAPPTGDSLSQPITCWQVHLDLTLVERAILSATGVEEVATRYRPDGSPEAFVTMRPPDPAVLKRTMARLLPGYAIVERLHVSEQTLKKTSSGSVDYSAFEKGGVLQFNPSHATDHELLVRDIIADVLSLDVDMITSESDFFLLGGTSLLLGQLSYQIRTKTRVSISVSAMFANSTVAGIASLIDKQERGLQDDLLSAYGRDSESDTMLDDSPNSSTVWGDGTFVSLPFATKSRSQHNPVVLFIQSIPFIFFNPMRSALTWAVLLSVMSTLSPMITDNFSERLAVLLIAITTARISTALVAPLCAIAFKWVVIGRYQPGIYKFWSFYHLRWWIVDQAVRRSGRGIFTVSPSLEIMYYRLMGANIGKNVTIAHNANLGEFDLLNFEDGCRVDRALVRGFCVERDGCFRLDHVVLGKNSVINTYTQISPGSLVQEDSVIGPHASSFEDPAPEHFSMYNRTALQEPRLFYKLFVAWPLFVLVFAVSYIPWFSAIFFMIYQTDFVPPEGGNALVALVYWFSNPERIMYHALSRAVRTILTPLVHLGMSLLVKRLLGFNKPSAILNQRVLLRRYVHSFLLSQQRLKRAFVILGTHYGAVSAVYRCMGAKIGERVYWPGSGIYCQDPELLEIGDDVVFGSRSEIFTTDCMGSEKIIIKNGAMIADRVVILPGVTVGRQTVLGSGTLTSRCASYEDGSTWIGSDRGEAVCLNKGNKDRPLTRDTTTPFGRAFYKRQATFFVFPYPMLVAINVVVACLCAMYWSIAAVAAAIFLHRVHAESGDLDLFAPSWYRFGVLYTTIAPVFIFCLFLQSVFAMLWVIGTKWLIIGLRKPGSYDWDKSSYCQRWQLHLALSRPIFGNGGVLSPLAGTAFIVWYFRALGASIGENCAIYAGGRLGLMTEPDLIKLGDNVALDTCSVVAHINSRGNFSLNPLRIGSGCAMRTGSRLLSGASMEDGSMLCEHTLLTSGEVADAGGVYIGWPAQRMYNSPSRYASSSNLKLA